jgi:hypothetical protein
MARASGCIMPGGKSRDPHSRRGRGKRLPCLNHVGVGDEVVIEHDTHPAALVWSVAPVPPLDDVFSAIGREARDERWERVPSNRANYLDHCLYVREAL